MTIGRCDYIKPITSKGLWTEGPYLRTEARARTEVTIAK